MNRATSKEVKYSVYHDVIIKRLALCKYLCSGHSSPSVSFFLGKCDFLVTAISVLILHVFFCGNNLHHVPL